LFEVFGDLPGLPVRDNPGRFGSVDIGFALLNCDPGTKRLSNVTYPVSEVTVLSIFEY
jgi:hypothetical protein